MCMAFAWLELQGEKSQTLDIPAMQAFSLPRSFNRASYLHGHHKTNLFPVFVIILWPKKFLKTKEAGTTLFSGRDDVKIEKDNSYMCPLSQLSRW